MERRMCTQAHRRNRQGQQSVGGRMKAGRRAQTRPKGWRYSQCAQTCAWGEGGGGHRVVLVVLLIPHQCGAVVSKWYSSTQRARMVGSRSSGKAQYGNGGEKWKAVERQGSTSARWEMETRRGRV